MVALASALPDIVSAVALVIPSVLEVPVSGVMPVMIGAIGAVVSMERVLRAPVHFLGLSLPEHGYHAPNEYFDWRQARGGILAFAKYLEQVGARPR